MNLIDIPSHMSTQVLNKYGKVRAEISINFMVISFWNNVLMDHSLGLLP